MAPANSTQTLLSPAELSFIHSSLSLTPPIRPDLRSSTQFRPLIAETDILASTNGSARICFSDGTEAIVGIKAELEKTPRSLQDVDAGSSNGTNGDVSMAASSGSESDDEIDAPIETRKLRKPRAGQAAAAGKVSDAWLEASIEIPGYRDDDNLPVFLGSMITETLLAEGSLKRKLRINARWHWKLYIDILLLSQPLSYPLPLLSLTTHLALLNARLPRLTSEPEDDPMFDDDWDAAIPLYVRSKSKKAKVRPPVTLLVMNVGDNVIFDPAKEELAVAEMVLAVSVVSTSSEDGMKLLAVRTIDPPSRLTPPGIPNSINPATANPGPASAPASQASTPAATHAGNVAGAPTNAAQEVLLEKEKGNLWSPPRGGVKRHLIAHVIKAVVGRGGVASEVLDGLANVRS